MTIVKIVNVVATASVCQDLDFEELEKHKEIFHDSEVYGGRVAYFKTGNMQGKVSLFPSGKMISIGTKSEKQAYHELELASKFLVEKGYAKHTGLDYKTQNLVLTVDFERSLNLRQFSETARAIYEPERFPGAIIRLDHPYKTSVLAFASGKTVVMGLKSHNQIEPTIKKLRQLVEANH